MLFALLIALAGNDITQSPAAVPGAAIAGQIVVAPGEPHPLIVVTALKQNVDAAGRITPTTAAMTITDQSGRFRLTGLTEGNYVVIGAPQPTPPFAQPPVPSGALVVTPTFYPGTSDKDAAQIIAIASGQIVSGLQFSMMSAPGYDVRGVVVDAAGAPLNDVPVALMTAAGDGIGSPATARSDERGTFRISGIVSGSYRLLAGTPMMSVTRDGSAVMAGLVGGGAVQATGGVFVGRPGIGGPGVPPPSGIPAMTPTPTLISEPIDVTVGNGNVSGLRIVVSARN
jgi:Carboxypeptidase regulatory-like domain